MRANNVGETVGGSAGGGGEPEHLGKVGALFSGIGRFSVRFRWLVIAVWLVGTVAAVALLPSLNSVTNNNNADFLPASSPTTHATQLENAFQQNNLGGIPVIVSRDGGALTADDQHAIENLRTSLSHVKNVVKVQGGAQSQDQQAAQFQALVDFNKGAVDPKTVVDDLRAAIRSADLPSDLQAHLAGQTAANVDSQGKSGNQNSQLQLVSVALILIILFLIFRSVLAPFVTLAPAFLVNTLAGPLVGAAGHAGLKVSPIAALLLVVLVLGAGTDYGLFLMFRVREEMGRGLPHREAVVRALARVGESVTFSAITVIAALVSLLAASFSFYSDLGVPLAIGIGAMLLAALTLLPALLAVLGRAVFWPSKIKSGTGRSGIWGRMSANIVQKPVATLIIGVLLFGGLAVVSLGYHASGFGGNGVTAPAGSDSAAGTDAQNKHFPDVAKQPTVVLFTFADPVWQNPQNLALAQRQLGGSAQFTTVSGPLSPNGATLRPDVYSRLRDQLGPADRLPAVQPPTVHVSQLEYQLYRASAQFISPDGHTVQYLVGLKAGDPGGTPAVDATPAIRDAVTSVQHVAGAVDSGVLGESTVSYDISAVSNSDLQTVIPIAIAVIGLLLALVMRSLIAPLYLIASVGLSYLAALGLAVLIFMKIGHENGMTFFMPFLMFIFLLALGEDYNILVMSRIREEAHNLTLRQAIAKALTTTGTTVTSAGIILAATFAVFAFVGGSGDPTVRDIGYGLAAGILMDTFLVRTLLVPSTAVLLGRWNWWPSRLGRKGNEPDEPPTVQFPADPDPVPAGGRRS